MRAGRATEGTAAGPTLSRRSERFELFASGFSGSFGHERPGLRNRKVAPIASALQANRGDEVRRMFAHPVGSLVAWPRDGGIVLADKSGRPLPVLATP